MNEPKFRVVALPDPVRDATNFYFIHDLAPGKCAVASVAEGGRLTWNPYAEGGEFPAVTFSIRGREKSLISKLMTALGKQGFEIPSEARMLGELDATKKHLLDMRTIVFKAKPDNKLPEET